MARRNLARYSINDWRAACPTVGAMRQAGWMVIACCPTCDLEVVADLARIEREKGPDFRLWGRTTSCRRRYCSGEAAFFVQPPGAAMEYRMTEAPDPPSG